MPQGFVQLCHAGKARLDDIHDFIDRWHDSDSDVALPEFLGMTEEQYHAWVVDPTILRSIVESTRSSA